MSTFQKLVLLLVYICVTCAGAAEPAIGNQLRGYGCELRVQVHLDTDSGTAKCATAFLALGVMDPCNLQAVVVQFADATAGWQHWPQHPADRRAQHQLVVNRRRGWPQVGHTGCSPCQCTGNALRPSCMHLRLLLISSWRLCRAIE